MAKFIYRCKGSANDSWDEGMEIEADTKAAAQSELDKIYGVERDKDGKQTNKKMIQVEITDQIK